MHFANNDNQTQGYKLFKIDTIYKSLKKKFTDVFIPYQKICIDESVVQWKGRLSFKQFLPKKHHRFGVKCFIMFDCRTGFIMNIIIYTRKETQVEVQNRLGISGSVVTTLMTPYSGLGHTLYVDNCYTSPLLFQNLYDNKTSALGTCKPDRQQKAKFPPQMETREYKTKMTPFLTAEKWVDKKPVLMLSKSYDNNLCLIDTGKHDHRTQAPS